MSVIEKCEEVEKNTDNSFKKTFTHICINIVASICVLMFCGLICYSLLINKISLESILATLLAFFSIFISVLFYFKADEASSKIFQ